MNRAIVMAYRLLLRDGDGTLPVDPVRLLKKCRNTRLYDEEEASKALGEPFTLAVDQDAVVYPTLDEHGTPFRSVVYRRLENPARVRFSLAHELGHIALGHTGTGAAQEREADLFASHLLCPRPVLDAFIRKGLRWEEQAMDVFFISQSAVRLLSTEVILPSSELPEAELLAQFHEALEMPLPQPSPEISWHLLRRRGLRC